MIPSERLPSPMHRLERLPAVSLYSGAGGMDIGFWLAGFDAVLANDIDSAAVATYNSVFPDHPAHLGDISTATLPAPQSVAVVFGGPPCQGFSVAGKMDPQDPRSQHVFRFLDAVEHLNPLAFVMENVKALAVNVRWRPILLALMERAEAAGFAVDLWLLNASHFGVPQARERMFLVGSRRERPRRPTAPTKSQPPTVRQALDALPRLGAPGNDDVCAAQVTAARTPVLRRSPYAGMLFNGQGRPINLDAPAPTLPASMGGNRTPIVDQENLVSGSSPWIEEYHRHLWKGGVPATTVPDRMRRITVQEAAALQTFPEWIEWSGPQSARYRQIGNAVPPLLAYYVAQSVRRSLGVEAAVEVEEQAEQLRLSASQL